MAEIVDIDSLETLVAKATSHLIGIAYLKASLEFVVDRIGARMGLITRARNFPTTRVSVVACTNPDAPREFELAGTPCELVYGGKPVAIEAELMTRFEPTRGSGCESFHGFPFFNESGQCIGHLGLFFQAPTILPKEIGTWLTKLSERLQSELQRLDMQQQLEYAKRKLDFQNRILKMAARQEPLDTVIEQIIHGIEAEDSQLLCCVMLPDSAMKTLTLYAGPSLPPEYCMLLHEIPIADGAGSCGTAAFTRERIVVEDIAEHPYWKEYRHLTLPHGLRSCWSQPILGPDRRLLGVFAAYRRQPSAPTPGQLQWIESFADLASLILDLYQSNEDLRSNSVKYRHFLQMSSDGVVVFDRDGRIEEVSDGFLAQVGASGRQHVVGSRIWDWDAATPEAAYRDRIAAIIEHPKIFETMHHRVGSEPWHAEISAAAFRLDKRTMIWASARNVTERKLQEAELLHRANTDELTGLANRRCFLSYLSTEFARSQRHRRPLSVLMVDIDRFKSINDRYGHATGDAVLHQTAAIWRHALRQEDLIGRVGGEEFAIVLPETDSDGAMQLAERIRLSTQAMCVETSLPSKERIAVTCSIGVATLEGHERDHEELLALADMALLEAKTSGRNRVLGASAMQSH